MQESTSLHYGTNNGVSMSASNPDLLKKRKNNSVSPYTLEEDIGNVQSSKSSNNIGEMTDALRTDPQWSRIPPPSLTGLI